MYVVLLLLILFILDEISSRQWLKKLYNPQSSDKKGITKAVC